MDASGHVEAGLESAVALARANGRPALFFINKCDRENANPAAPWTRCGPRSGRRSPPLHIAIGAADTFTGYVDLVHRKAYQLQGGKEVEVPVPANLADEVAPRRDQLLEAASEADDDVLTKYLEGEEISDAELEACLHKAIRAGIVAPVLVGSASKDIGVRALIDAIVHYLPSSAEFSEIDVTDSKGKEVKLSTDAAGPLVARVFKTTADPFVGRLTYIRILSGTLQGQGQAWNSTRGEPERIGQLLLLHGKDQETVGQLHAGEIGAVAKLTVTGTGDTLSASREQAYALPPLSFPVPTLQVAIEPQTKADLDKMGSALQRMLEEEPSAHVIRSETGEQILVAMGDAHVAVLGERLKRKFGAAIVTKTPRVPLQGDDPRQDPGPRPLQEADRRPRHVRRRLDRDRAEPGRRRRVRRARGRRHRAQELLPRRREGHPRGGGRRRAGRLPAHRLQGDPVRRLVPRRSTPTSCRSRSRPRWRSRRASSSASRPSWNRS